ncbi:MAG: hypothetical protein ABI288_02875 [Ginsengibacter sp.]
MEKKLGSIYVDGSILQIATKKLIMIIKLTSPQIAFLKYCLVIVVLIAAIFMFSAKSIVAQEKKDTAQLKTQSIPNSTLTSKEPARVRQVDFYAGGTPKGVTTEVLTEYQKIINRIKTSEMSWSKFRENISLSDSKRLETIFMQMNLIQQQQQTVVFFKPIRPLPRVIPTEKQFENFKNAKVYGLWINEKKVENGVLINYTAEDFVQVFISKLYGAAKENKRYSYQLNMMTKDYYQAYYDRTIADKSNKMVFQSVRVIKE